MLVGAAHCLLFRWDAGSAVAAAPIQFTVDPMRFFRVGMLVQDPPTNKTPSQSTPANHNAPLLSRLTNAPF